MPHWKTETSFPIIIFNLNNKKWKQEHTRVWEGSEANLNGHIFTLSQILVHVCKLAKETERKQHHLQRRNVYGKRI